MDVIGSDGTLQLRLPIAKDPLCYLVDPHTLIFLSKMRNGGSNQNPTTRTNAVTSLTPKEFYEHGLNQKIAARGNGGVEDFNHFI